MPRVFHCINPLSMRRFGGLLLALAFSINLNAQTVIQMVADQGVYKVPCEVNGLKVKKSGTKAVVSWKKAANASKYEVLCSLKKNFKKNVKKLTVKTTKATIKKLKKGKTYYFKVRGISGSIKGSYSAIKKVKI